MYYSNVMYHMIIFITKKTNFLIIITHLRAENNYNVIM